VAATPWVIALANRLGAIDSPDGFRKIGHGATPRMGGLAVAFGLLFAFSLYAALAPRTGSDLWADLPMDQPAALAALAVILGVGLIDDRRGLGPMAKLAAQGFAAVLLFYAGFRIQKFFLFGLNFDLDALALPLTCFWFIGCMNV
jgi:UDP-GlcNAc:undecaprenyl-phosphate GlcNAc-1-phosphate transferase